jgi:hypothetical protein
MHELLVPQQIHPRWISTGSYLESQPRWPAGSLDSADHGHL